MLLTIAYVAAVIATLLYAGTALFIAVVQRGLHNGQVLAAMAADLFPYAIATAVVAMSVGLLLSGEKIDPQQVMVIGVPFGVSAVALHAAVRQSQLQQAIKRAFDILAVLAIVAAFLAGLTNWST